jgi:hypothetical protein
MGGERRLRKRGNETLLCRVQRALNQFVLRNNKPIVEDVFCRSTGAVRERGEANANDEAKNSEP